MRGSITRCHRSGFGLRVVNSLPLRFELGGLGRRSGDRLGRDRGTGQGLIRRARMRLVLG